MVRRRAQPLGRPLTGNVTRCAVSVERHGRIQSRTPILGPDRALLALGPSANRKSIKLAKYILLLRRKSTGISILTRNERSLVFPCSRAGRCKLPASLLTPRQRNGRPRGEIQVPALSRSHQQLTAFGSFPEWFHCKFVSKGPAYPAASRPMAGSTNQPAAHIETVSGNRMKLTKKQLSASYVTQATVATGRWATDDVANHRDSRLDGCSVASPQGKVESIPQVSFCTTSGDKAMESIAGLENQPGLEITPLQLYVEEGLQSVCLRHLLRKWQGGMAMAATGKAGYLGSVPPSSECE